MASVPLLNQSSTMKGGVTTPGGKSTARQSKGGSRGSSVRGSKRDLTRGGGSATGGLGAVPEDDVLQASRVSSKGSADKRASRAPALKRGSSSGVDPAVWSAALPPPSA